MASRIISAVNAAMYLTGGGRRQGERGEGGAGTAGTAARREQRRGGKPCPASRVARPSGMCSTPGQPWGCDWAAFRRCVEPAATPSTLPGGGRLGGLPAQGEDVVCCSSEGQGLGGLRGRHIRPLRPPGTHAAAKHPPLARPELQQAATSCRPNVAARRCAQASPHPLGRTSAKDQGAP